MRGSLVLFTERMRISGRLRSNLQGRGYLEVSTFALQSSAGTDPHIEPVTADYFPLMDGALSARALFLHTSPEFAMKRLLCRGMEAIYQICQVARQGEMGDLHTPEFTMAEWYRRGWNWNDLMSEVEAVVSEVADNKALVGGRKISLRPPFPRVRISEALAESGVDCRELDELAPALYVERFQELWVEKVDPWLVGRGAIFLTHFPAPLAILAAPCEDDPGLAERFELVVGGIEIANGATELLEAADYRARFEADNLARGKLAKRALPLPEGFLADLENYGLAPCAGVALGVDRLAMVALGAGRIGEVQALLFGR